MAEKPFSRRRLLRSAGAGGLVLLLPRVARARPRGRRAVRPAENLVLQWNTAFLQGVRDSRLGPPMVSRALAVAHTAIFDAWATYDGVAVGTRFGGRCVARHGSARRRTRAPRSASPPTGRRSTSSRATRRPASIR